MSGYFDGLMRSSGLPLGDAPVLGRPPRGETALPESDAAIPAAEPLVGPLEIAARMVQPVTDATPSMAPAATPERTDPSPAPAVDPVREFPSRPGQAVPASTRPAAEPTVSRERMIQAAMRWVADGSARDRTQGAPSHRVTENGPATIEPVVRPVTLPVAETASVPAAVTAQVRESSPVDIPVTRAAAPTQGTPPDAAGTAPTRPRSVATPMPHALPQTMAPTADDEVHVSIGAIHLRVEAPTPPALQAAATTPQRPAPTVIAAPTRSGLSRRALRRI